MRVVTIVSLGASAVLGLGALFVAKAVMPNADGRGAHAAQAPVAGAPIVVATKDLKYGAKLDASVLTVIQAPPNVVPQGGFTSVDQVLAADKGGAPVVLVPIAAHEPILPMKISGPGARPTVAAEIADGMRAYTIKVTDDTGVGGHALPGDHVDVVLMRDLTPSGQTRSYISYVVVQNVRVLGIDLNADPTSDKPATPNTATLEVSVEDAQKLSMASTLGTLSLALRRTGQPELVDAPPMRTSDFLAGGPRPAPTRSVSRGPSGPRLILIVEGQASKRGGGRRASSSASAKAPPPANAAPAVGAGVGGAAASIG
jgi:pilus assembly protein CpaB